MAIIMTKKLVKEYVMGKEHVVKALNGVDISIEKGEFMAVMGPSGSGKSTLLNMLGCLDTPTAGSVVIDGIDVGKAAKQELPIIRNKKIGFVFQQHHLVPTLSALENVMLPLKYARVPKSEAKARASKLMAEVGLADRLHHKPSELSGGQQQRVAIARSLVCEPALILADEPTGALDTVTGEQIIKLMRRVNESHRVTFIIVTHNAEVADVCDRVITMRDGSVVSDVSQRTWPSALAAAR